MSKWPDECDQRLPDNPLSWRRSIIFSRGTTTCGPQKSLDHSLGSLLAATINRHGQKNLQIRVTACNELIVVPIQEII